MLKSGKIFTGMAFTPHFKQISQVVSTDTCNRNTGKRGTYRQLDYKIPSKP
jgi:hypothetical protein